MNSFLLYTSFILVVYSFFLLFKACFVVFYAFNETKKADKFYNDTIDRLKQLDSDSSK